MTKHTLKLIWKYTKGAWRNPIGRVQFILLGVECLVLLLIVIYVENPLWFFIVLLLLPINEEIRMRHGYEIEKFLFNKTSKTIKC